MINQEKVLRMTKMASYEEHGGRKDRAVVGYFRSDYIGKQTIISLIVITAAFLAGLGAYLVFHFSEVMGNIYSMDLVGTAKKILTLYLMAAVLYVAVTYVIYTIRYAKAKKRLQLFLEYLDCLDQDGEEETAERKKKMTQLLVIREYIKNFYTKYEEFIVPLLKFVLGLILFLTINGRMGYMEKIDHVAIVLVAALLCSFLPLGVMVFLSAMFLLLHTYALSAECVVVLLLAYIIVLVIYLRFAPKAHLLLLLTPLLFVWKIPYAAPLAAGLFGTPGAAAAVAGGVVVYYVLAYITGNAQAFGGGESDTMLQRFSDMGTGVIENKEMLIVVTAFAITAILVYAIRRMSINYSRAIAVLVGTLADIVILLIGDLMYDANFSLAGVILGSIVCALIALVMQFFQFNLDYARTEKVQFKMMSIITM